MLASSVDQASGSSQYTGANSTYKQRGYSCDLIREKHDLKTIELLPMSLSIFIEDGDRHDDWSEELDIKPSKRDALQQVDWSR